MTYKERIAAAFNHEPVDRVPFSFWFHFVENEDKVDGLQNPEVMDAVYEGHKRYIEQVKPDFVKVMCDGLFRYPSKGISEFNTVKDLDKMDVIGPDHPWIRAHVKHAHRIASLRGETAYIYNIFSPSMLLRILKGEEKFIAAFKEDPDMMSDAMKRLGDGLTNLVEALMTDGGVDGIYYCVQNQNIDIISDEEHEKYFGEADRKVLLAANRINDFNLLHVCGYEGKRNHVKQWTSYPSKAVNWAVNVEGVSIPEGRKIFENRCVVGGFANTKNDTLYRGTEEEVRAETRRIVEEAGRDGLVVAADCSLPFSIDWQRLIWVSEELEQLA